MLRIARIILYRRATKLQKILLLKSCLHLYSCSRSVGVYLSMYLSYSDLRAENLKDGVDSGLESGTGFWNLETGSFRE